jgi:hypothetical protein
MSFASVVRAVPRSFLRPNVQNNFINTYSKTYLSTNARLTTFQAARPAGLTLYKPSTAALVRYASNTSNPPGIDPINTQKEEKIGEKVMRAHPERVTLESTTHPPFHELGEASQEKEVDMMAGIKNDLVRIIISTKSNSNFRIVYYQRYFQPR